MLHHRAFSFLIIEILFGFVLLVNCLAGIIRRDGMYDADSTKTMYWAQVAGMGLGAALVAHASWMLRLLY